MVHLVFAAYAAAVEVVDGGVAHGLALHLHGFYACEVGTALHDGDIIVVPGRNGFVRKQDIFIGYIDCGQVCTPTEQIDSPNEGGVAGFMVRDVKPEQPAKAEAPIDVTELGMVRDVKPVQPAYLYIILYQLITC